MNNSRFILAVADIYIAIDLSRIDDPEIIKVLSGQIQTYYKRELVLHYKRKPDYTIYYIADEEYRFMKQQQSKNDSIHYFLESFVIDTDSAEIHYHVSMAQFQFFLKLILQSVLANSRGFILHSSAISDGKNAFLFLGPNGIGKSTIVSNLSPHFVPFADDMVVIRKIGREWRAYQLPLEKKPYKSKPNESFPVRALCYLEQGNPGELKSLSHQQAGKKLLLQLVQQWASQQQVPFVLQFLAKNDHFSLKTPIQTDISIIETLVSKYR